MTAAPKLPPANARTLGALVRKTLNGMDIPWKVRCRSVSFAGLGYGSAPFAEIETERALTVEEKAKLAETLRELRALPTDQGGGAGIIQMNGTSYPFGGAIHYHEYLPE
jgi:hypothetical protein